MAMDAFETDLAAPFGTAPKGAGQKLIERRYYLARATAYADTIPLGATRAVIRCYGAGGPAGSAYAANGYSSLNGGGGAFAKETITCVAGMPLTVAVPNDLKYGFVATSYAASIPNEGPSTVVSYGGLVVCKAAGGKSGQTMWAQDGNGYQYVNSSGILDGLATNCIGSIKISAVSGVPQPEPGKEIVIQPGKLGVTNPINGTYSLEPVWPGGGARAADNSNEGVWARGVAIVEFWGPAS